MTALSARRLRLGRVQLYLEWRDLWRGLFVGKDAVYICPLPTVVIRIARAAPPAQPDPLDAAMFTAYLQGNWRWILRKMGAEEREAAIAAVLRHSRWLNRDDPDDWELSRSSVAEWED